MASGQQGGTWSGLARVAVFVGGGVVFYFLFFATFGPRDASAAAARSLCAIAEGNEAYHERHGEYAKDLFELESERLIDLVLANGVKGGYTFNYDRESRKGGEAGWACNARPIKNDEGNVHLFVDETQVVRFEIDAMAGEQSEPYE